MAQHRLERHFWTTLTQRLPKAIWTVTLSCVLSRLERDQDWWQWLRAAVLKEGNFCPHTPWEHLSVSRNLIITTEWISWREVRDTSKHHAKHRRQLETERRQVQRESLWQCVPSRHSQQCRSLTPLWCCHSSGGGAPCTNEVYLNHPSHLAISPSFMWLWWLTWLGG